MAAALALVETLKTKRPDQKWLLKVLSTYLPDCVIFNKDYRPSDNNSN